MTEDPYETRARARLGTVLREKWRLDELLGVGGMAAVYAATHRNGKRVAVKIMHADLATNRDLTQRFLREGYVANRIGHPGAVSILDDDTAPDGAAFLVMELLEGETLEAYWRSAGRRLPTDRVLSIVSQILDILAAAHSRGIVHRDVKPENVFLTKDQQIKVLDFGIAHLRESSLRGNATVAGLTMGTPGFMSPEQARGEAIDHRSDLWSVGACMFTLLSGQSVHDAPTVNLQLAAAMMQDAPPLERALPGAHPAVAAIVNRALAFDSMRRWHDAEAMRAAVDAALALPEIAVASISPVAYSGRMSDPATRPIAVTTGANGATLPPVKSSRAPLFIALAAVGMAAIGAVGALLLVPHARVAAAGAASAPAAVEAPPSVPPTLNAAAAPAPAALVDAGTAAVDDKTDDKTPDSAKQEKPKDPKEEAPAPPRKSSTPPPRADNKPWTLPPPPASPPKPSPAADPLGRRR